MKKTQNELNNLHLANEELTRTLDAGEILVNKRKAYLKIFKMIEEEDRVEWRHSLLDYFQDEVKEMKVSDEAFLRLLNFITTINKKTTYKDLYLFCKDYIQEDGITEFPHPFSKNKIISYLATEYKRQTILRGYETKINKKSFKSLYEKEIPPIPMNIFVEKALKERGLLNEK